MKKKLPVEKQRDGKAKTFTLRLYPKSVCREGEFSIEDWELLNQIQLVESASDLLRGLLARHLKGLPQTLIEEHQAEIARIQNIAKTEE